MRVKEALETYQFTISNLSEQSQEWYMKKLRPFTEWCAQNGLELEDITAAHVKNFLDGLRTRINPRTKQPITSDTLHGYAKVIKLFLKWCSQDEEFREYVKARTHSLIPIPKVDKKTIETFTPEQIKALFVACSKEIYPRLVSRDRAILSVLLDTGVRASELCGLTIGNVHLDPNDSYILVMGKGRKEREIGLGTQARTALHRYIRQHRKYAKPDEVVFQSRSFEQLNINGLDQILYRLRDWAKLGDVAAGAHKFRHTFAVNYLLNGGDVYKLSRLMGHTSVSTTERYVRSMKQREARKGMSVLDNLK
ncbi:MAG TPA: tyrosine-type recombinase/integrase [Ktedonosporobacter sp.]|jgi:integrase/recombinase XerD|nr:tyrosine-type recombinase/integrase [Ktedonosporobacter sp.]